jgi:DNA-binding NarL/FixJ family response regulator
VLSLVHEGTTTAEIAPKLTIAPGTVRSHIQRIYWKLGRAADRELREA